MNKPAIPDVRTGQVELDRALSAVKQSLDAITGQARNAAKLTPLLPTATLADTVIRLNALLDRLQ
jgi:hypothetical protein